MSDITETLLQHLLSHDAVPAQEEGRATCVLCLGSVLDHEVCRKTACCGSLVHAACCGQVRCEEYARVTCSACFRKATVPSRCTLTVTVVRGFWTEGMVDSVAGDLYTAVLDEAPGRLSLLLGKALLAPRYHRKNNPDYEFTESNTNVIVYGCLSLDRRVRHADLALIALGAVLLHPENPAGASARLDSVLDTLLAPLKSKSFVNEYVQHCLKKYGGHVPAPQR